MTRRRRTRAAVAAIAGVTAIAVAFLAWQRAGTRDDAPAAAPARATPAPARPTAGRAPTPAPGVLHDDAGAVVGRRLDNPRGDRRPVPSATERARAVEDYKRANRYPPTSQLLEPHHTDLMRPNQRYEQELPSQFDPEIRFVYTGEKNTIVGDEAIVTWLRVTRDGQPLAVEIVAGQARIEATGAQVPLVYTRRGDAYVNELRPSTLGADRAAMIETEVWFEATPGAEESRSLPFFYTPAAAVPARFTGEFRDAIEDGSLVVYAGVDVAKDGHYVIDCNLYGPADEPVMFARHKGPLPRGRSEVRLLFFGKALRDRGVAPPFHIGQLRGGRHVPGQDPDVESMPLEDWRYTTRTTFTLDELSDAEWEDEHKRRMIEFLEQHGGKPRGDPRP